MATYAWLVQEGSNYVVTNTFYVMQKNSISANIHTHGIQYTKCSMKKILAFVLYNVSYMCVYFFLYYLICDITLSSVHVWAHPHCFFCPCKNESYVHALGKGVMTNFISIPYCLFLVETMLLFF